MDSGELPALFKDNLNHIYEDLILNNDNDFHPPEDLIDSLVTSISSAESQNKANITLETTNYCICKVVFVFSKLLYLFEFSRTYKVGGISSPYATIE